MTLQRIQNLIGKVAVVTGGSRGIGCAVCERFAIQGADIAIIYRNDKKSAEDTATAVAKHNRRAVLYRCDISDFDKCKEVTSKIIADFGAVDILVNNAGITRDMLLVQMKETDWDIVLDTNLKGVFNMSRHILGQMIKRKSGKIINITSTSGCDGNAGQSNYSASKAGIIGLTKALSKEVASRGITVNAVAPGFIDTDMTSILKEELKSQIKDRIPLGHFGKPEDIASIVTYLASPAAGYITGQVIRVDGGLEG